MSHIDFGIPTQSRLRHRDLDDVCVPPQNAPSGLPGRPGQPQVPLVDHRVPLVDHQVSLVDHSSRRATPWSSDPFRRPELSALVDEVPSSTAAHFSGRRSAPSTSQSNCPSWSMAHPSPRPRGRGQHFTPVNTSQWRAAMDSEMASYRSTGTYVDKVPPFGTDVADGMWIFRVKRPPGSPPFLKARYVAKGFSQREEVLQRFKLQHSTVQRTPIAVDHRLTGPFPDEPFEPSGPYVELVGCLMYLMSCTRPDLAFPLSILVRFVAPGRHRPVHWIAAVRVAKYLTTTSGVGLVLGGRQDVVLTGHSDSSYADDAETHRSTQGYCFSLGSGTVSWRSTRSSSVSTSTA
ncbi:unnamed protein product [Closterium sp. NIES-53]